MIRFCEPEAFEVRQRVLQPRKHEEAAVRRVLADEQTEHRLSRLPAPQKGPDHRQLVEVREQCARRLIQSHASSLSSPIPAGQATFPSPRDGRQSLPFPGLRDAVEQRE